jgi:hypothetical protein
MTIPRPGSGDACPVVAATRRAGRTNDLLAVVCPFCGREHVHGACGKGSPRGAGDGYREAECFGGDYLIREVA